MMESEPFVKSATVSLRLSWANSAHTKRVLVEAA